MRSGTRWLLYLSALLALAGCRSKQTLAVFDLLDEHAVLDETARGQLADHLAARLGEGGHVRILPRENLAGACPAHEHACLQQKASGQEASGFVTARVLRPGESCTLALAVYPASGGAAIRSSSVPCDCTADALLEAVGRAVGRLGSPWSDQAPVADGAARRMQRQAERLREEQARMREELQERIAKLEAERALLEERLRAQEHESVVAQPRPIDLQAERGRSDDERASDAQTAGSIDRAAIMREMRRHMERIKDCKARLRIAQGTVELQLSFRIAPSGKTTDVSVETEDLTASDVAACVTGVVRSMRFPSHEGEPVRIEMPLALR